MESVLDKPITLHLNALWQPIGHKSVREAIEAMNSFKEDSDVAAQALDIEYFRDENGEVDFSKPPISIIPYKWAEWAKLPIREYDLVVRGVKGEVRAPTVIIAVHYKKMPLKTFRATKSSLYKRDGGKCCYTGKHVPFSSATIEHILPRSRGGKNDWTNLAICDPQVNFKKGNKTLKESGLKLLIKPKEPNSVAVAALITEARHRDWELFLVKNH